MMALPKQPKYPLLHAHTSSFPLIDNHAHPLLRVKPPSSLPSQGRSLLSIFSEIHGPALHTSAPQTLAFYSGVKELGAFFGCPEPNAASSSNDKEAADDADADKTWESILTKRAERPYEALCRDSFKRSGIQCVLLDDGLDLNSRDCLGVEEHDTWFPTASEAKRIVRIEVEAQTLLTTLFSNSTSGSLQELLFSFKAQWAHHLVHFSQDARVVGFKSIACYRSGLDISLHCTELELEDSFRRVQERLINLANSNANGGQGLRLGYGHKVLIDYLVRTTMAVAGTCGKPVQFHTGLGDADLFLTHASPALLQPLIKAFPKTSIVLLHASYPFTQEAGYLTSVYPNVHLDVGEVFLYVSRDGQRETVRRVLEMCPVGRVLWSTDASFFPEAYYLAAVNGRKALYDVLARYVEADDISEAQAISITKRVLFENSNRLYGLGLVPDWKEPGREGES